MKTCKEIAIEWGLSERTVNDLCKKGRVPGAVKIGKAWQIPDYAKKPVDGRISSGKYIKKTNKRKSLPIGISDYVRAQSEYYYVDKTLLIKKFLDKKPLVSLFTRPRRFGKTLNMDMLRVFFEISGEDTSKYFKDKDIWKGGEELKYIKPLILPWQIEKSTIERYIKIKIRRRRTALYADENSAARIFRVTASKCYVQNCQCLSQSCRSKGRR